MLQTSCYHTSKQPLAGACNCRVHWTISRRDRDSLDQLRFSALNLFSFPAVAASESSNLRPFMFGRVGSNRESVKRSKHCMLLGQRQRVPLFCICSKQGVKWSCPTSRRVAIILSMCANWRLQIELTQRVTSVGGKTPKDKMTGSKRRTKGFSWSWSLNEYNYVAVMGLLWPHLQDNLVWRMRPSRTAPGVREILREC